MCFRVKMPYCSVEYTLHLIAITTIINSELVAMLPAKASVAQLADHRIRFAGSRVSFPAESSEVAFFVTSPG